MKHNTFYSVTQIHVTESYANYWQNFTTIPQQASHDFVVLKFTKTSGPQFIQYVHCNVQVHCAASGAAVHKQSLVIFGSSTYWTFGLFHFAVLGLLPDYPPKEPLRLGRISTGLVCHSNNSVTAQW